MKKFEKTPNEREKLLEVYKFAKDLGIGLLKEKPLNNDDLEIRIGIGCGLISPEMIVLRISRNDYFAEYFFIKSVGGASSTKRLALSRPKIGWEALLSYLNKNGVTVPIEHGFQDNYRLGDAICLVLETKKGSEYDYRYFETSTEEGEKLFRIFSMVVKEFDVDRSNLG